GGLFNDSGTLDLSYCTITANVVPGGLPDDGGGIFNLWGSVEFESSIIAANLGTVDFVNGEFGFLVSYGYNLIGSTSGYFPLEAGDQFVAAAALKLGPLQDNGGPTFTHALLCGSPAINAGDNTFAPTTDQRGFARIVGGVMDIGAYEADNSGGSATPTVSCPALPAALAPANCQAAVPDVLSGVTVTGGCAGAQGITLSQDPLAGTIVGAGTYTITVTATESAGTSASCTTSFTVTDNTPPTVNCPALPAASADGNCQAAVPNILSGVTV